jgi:F0F1-type ATP synthase alpha subunit
MLKQSEFNPISAEEQVAAIFAMNAGYFDHVEIRKVKETQKTMIDFVKNHDVDLLESIKKDWNDDIKDRLSRALEVFKNSNH